MKDFDFTKSALRTIAMERDALSQLLTRIGAPFEAACKLLLSCEGRVIVTGIGKSGHIANKIAATLASTGTPAFFVHPSEASHGDFGMITQADMLIAISSSGASSEITTLLPLIKRQGIPLISMSGNERSPLAEAAVINLDISVISEACPLNLAPTSSTTVTLALGDAIAVALLEARGFTAEDFAFSHPGGTLGKKLLLKVQDVMHCDSEIPKTALSASLKEALKEMTAKGLGMTIVVDDNGQLCGIFTDGDLRRCIDRGININNISTREVMSQKPRTIQQSILAAEALSIMQNNKITALVVANNDEKVVGVLHMHDLLRAGII